MEPDQILACQFSAWYPNFSDVAFRSKIIPLPSSFLEFLLQDGVFLPEGSQAVSSVHVKHQCCWRNDQRGQRVMHFVSLSRCLGASRLCHTRNMRVGQRRMLAQEAQRQQQWCAIMCTHAPCMHACMQAVLERSCDLH